MKKTLVFLIVGFMVLGLFTVQTINAQPADDAKNIVGTWTGESRPRGGVSVIQTMTFNANGSFVSVTQSVDRGTGEIESSKREEGNYYLNNSKLVTNVNGQISTMDYHLSTDDNMLVIPATSPVVWFSKK